MRSRLSLLAASALLIAAAARPARAQSEGHGFLFGPPVGSFTVHGGYAGATARSDLWSFTTDQLTLNRRDLGSASVDAEAAMVLGPRYDLAFSVGYSGQEKRSEFRHFVDNNDQPIEQTTKFERVPLLLTARAYLAPRGRAIGHYAWIPARLAPFVGLGAGATWYRFHQEGDWVDYKTMDVFPATLESSGWAPTAQGLAGVDISLGPRFVLTGQTGYLWSRGKPEHDFSSFDAIDLSGISTTLGLRVRF